MQKTRVKKCPKCGQQLRFPEDIGGVLMECPTCGKSFYSDFKLKGTEKRNPRIYEMHEVQKKRGGGIVKWLYEKCFCFWFKS